MLGKTFNARINREHKQVGIREVFSVIDTGGSYDVKLLFGLDHTLNPTVPAVYTKNGFATVPSIISTDNSSAFAEYLSARRGIYTMLGYTQLLCEVTGKVTNYAWSSVSINYYILGGLKSDTEVYGQRVSNSGVYGSFHMEDKLTKLIESNLLLSLPSKAKFYASRCKSVVPV